MGGLVKFWWIICSVTCSNLAGAFSGTISHPHFYNRLKVWIIKPYKNHRAHIGAVCEQWCLFLCVTCMMHCEPPKTFSSSNTGIFCLVFLRKVVFLQLAHHSHCPSNDMGCDTCCLAGNVATVDASAAITVLHFGHHDHPTSCHLALRRGLPSSPARGLPCPGPCSRAFKAW